MEDVLLPDDFIEQSREGVVIDVRTPAEFLAGHIPGAINLPLFTNEERVEVGTLYVQQGKDRAVEKGLERVGPKLAGFVIQARELSAGKPIFLYCWRGGMRSGSMAWLFRTAGLKTILLKGGYKAYRNSFLDLLARNDWNLVVLGGPTGSGKTDILRRLRDNGQQVIDLEALAHHKGSAFGALGESAQPTTEHFINLLHTCLRAMNPALPIWCEGESISIGKVFIPIEFYSRMISGLFILLEVSRPQRAQNILKDYGQFSTDELIASFSKIEKRLGNKATNEAIEHINAGNLEPAVEIALRYYDKGYESSMRKHWPVTHPCIIQSYETESNAQQVLEMFRHINK